MPPVEFTPEEQAKVDTHLKELGWDGKADEVLKKTREEAKTHREAKEAADKKATDLETELKAIKEKEAKAADEAKALAKADEDKKKTEFQKELEKAVAAVEDAMDKRLTKQEEKAVKDQQKILDQLKTRDRKILTQAVKTAAVRHGIIDDELVSLINLEGIEVTDGEPDYAKINEAVEAHAKSKPHLYGDEEAIRKLAKANRESSEQSGRPDAKEKPGKGKDWSLMKPEEFEAEEARLLAARR